MSVERSRDAKGRFAEETLPPCRRILLSLPEPLIQALDDYRKKHGTRGRGETVERLLEGALAPPSPPPIYATASKHEVTLELVGRNDPLYKHYREKHYIPDQGIVGQQLQYIIFYQQKPVGIIGGASAVYANEARDQFFGLAEDKDRKTVQLNSIINNNVFKLDYPAPNLATIILREWRSKIKDDWKNLYGVAVAGFETFVIEERLWNGKTRNGACYRADNWNLVGISKGYNTTNVRGRSTAKKNLKEKKLVYCRKEKNVPLCEVYNTSWNNHQLQMDMAKRREEMLGGDHLDALLRGIRSE